MPTNDDDFRLPPIPPMQAQGLCEGIAAIAYAIGATHFRDLGMPMGVTFYKLGISARRDQDDKVFDLRRMEYGSRIAHINAPDRTIRVSNPSNEVFLCPLHDNGQNPRVAEALAGIPHGEIRDGVVAFRAPPDVPFTDLERAFNEVLALRNFNLFLESEDGARRLAAVGLPPTARLFTDYDLMGRPRRSLATELFCIRPRAELQIILRAIAVAIERVRAAHARRRH